MSALRLDQMGPRRNQTLNFKSVISSAADVVLLAGKHHIALSLVTFGERFAPRPDGSPSLSNLDFQIWDFFGSRLVGELAGTSHGSVYYGKPT